MPLTLTQHLNAGFLALDLPSEWTLEVQPETVEARGPGGAPVLHLRALAQQDPGAGSAVDAVQADLERWIHVHVSQKHTPVKMLSGENHPTAVASAVEPGRLWQRLLRRAPSTAWRFWAIRGEHLLVLASVRGEPEQITRHAGTLDRIVASVKLPDQAILLGRRFADTVVALARTHYPRTSVAVIDDLHLQFGTRRVNLVGLQRQYLEAPGQLADHVRRYLDQIVCGDAADDTPREWHTVREFIMPTLVSAEEFARLPADVAHEEWINELYIVYVVDERGTTRTITRGDLRRWRLDQDALHEQAITNLVTRSHDITMEGSRTDGYTMLALSTPECYNATRVLLPDLHKKLREHLGTTFYAAMPNREFLLAFSTDREEVLSRVRQQVASDFAKARNPLSAKLFLVTPDGIAGDPQEAENYSEWLGDKWR